VTTGYGNIMLPACSPYAFFGGLQAVRLPAGPGTLAWTREIEDRLLAPMPIPLVAVEKMSTARCAGWPLRCHGADRAARAAQRLVAGIGGLAPRCCAPCSVRAGRTMGLAIAPWVPPRRINVLFA